MHLFIITVFIACIAPFGGYFVAGLKRALGANRLGQTLHKGGVLDRIECILVTGFFLLIYINALGLVCPTSGETAKRVKEMILSLSDDAQKELYFRLKKDLALSI